ncbi:MAG TPA: hypothetical protein VJ111_05345 [Chitinophagaceae bacterium]|nr:hypothetical protein [Chitinophagaceae bacterium]
MNKRTLALLLLTASCYLMSCDRRPFVEHKLEFEKVADDCKEQQAYFRLNSNFGGERYEFEKCLSADFNKDQLTTERRGDTVLVSFKKASAAEGNKVYHITLDIDSYPKYHFLTIDKDTYSISSTEK